MPTRVMMVMLVVLVVVMVMILRQIRAIDQGKGTTDDDLAFQTHRHSIAFILGHVLILQLMGTLDMYPSCFSFSFSL